MKKKSKKKYKKYKKNKSKKAQSPSKTIQINKTTEENIIYPIDNEELENFTKEIENEPEIFNYKPKNIKKTIKKLDEDKYVNKNYNPYAIIGLLNNKKNPFLEQTSNNNKEIQINPNYTNNKEYLSKYELIKSKFKESKETILDNKVEEKNLGYLDKNFLLLIDKQLIDNNKDNYYYKHLIYGDKKFYLMTKGKYILKIKELNYYCNNNNTTKRSIDWTKHSICKYIIKYNKVDENYYIINGHSDECLSIRKQKYENIQDIDKEITNYNDYKILLTNKLQKDPLITVDEFKNGLQNSTAIVNIISI